MENPHGSERKSKGTKHDASRSRLLRDLNGLSGGAHNDANSNTSFNTGPNGNPMDSNAITWSGGFQVDLLEIFHARQLRDAALSQLRRLNQQTEHHSLDQRMRQHAIAGYYKALLLTSAELLQELGDDPHAS